MGKEKINKKMGRPIKKIDFAELDKLCELQCNIKEIASFFDCHEDTINNAIKKTFNMTFSAYFKQKGAGGKISLRRMQWQNAEKGNTAMLIWLGKQYLNQTDKQEITKESTSKGISDETMQKAKNVLGL